MTTSPASILIVEDEPHFQLILRIALSGEGYRTLEAQTGAEARSLASTRQPDVVLLDLDLPDVDGGDLVRDLRKAGPERPIIVVSARDREDDKVKAFELGADDYVTKPFAAKEFLARIRVALRHAAAGQGVPTKRTRSVLSAGDVEVDLDRHLVFVGGREVHLTPNEYDLLSYLMKHVGKVVPHGQLLKAVWGPAYKDHRAYLRVYMAQLRRKLEANPARPRYLLTEPGVGYRMRDRA